MIQEIRKWELIVLIALTMLFPFLATNYNTNLGLIYSVFTIIAFIYIIADPHRDIAFKKPNNSWLVSVFIAGAAVVLFLLGSTYIIIPGVKSLLTLIASSTPILSSNPLVEKIVFGLLVATSETLLFFVYLFDLLASVIGIKIDRKNLGNWKLWALMIGISFLFLIFHLTSKSVGSLPDSGAILGTVFVMGMVSMALIVWTGQAIEAVLFHIILNSLAIGLIAFTVINKLLGIG